MSLAAKFVSRAITKFIPRGTHFVIPSIFAMNQKIALLKNLVSIPSVSTHESEAVDFLIGEAQKLNFDEVKKDGAGNFVARRGNGEKTILLVGHIDTVPGDIPVKIKDNKLHGRGSVDAKGSLATFVWAAREAELPKNLTVIIIGCVEEEIYTSKGARHILDKYSPGFIIIGEPSGWDRITIGYKGGLRFNYKDNQSLAHASTGQNSTTDKAVDFVNEARAYLSKFKPKQSGIFYEPHFELRSFNTSHNGLTERVELNGNLRVPPGFEVLAFKNFLSNYPVEISEDIAPIAAEKNNDLVKAFLASIRHSGGEPRFVKKTGSSDMNILASYWPKIPILAYGPGDSKLDHTPDEHLDLEEYLKSINVLKQTLPKI